MPRRYSVVCDDDLCERVDDLSREYELTEQEVLRQLLRRGLEACDGDDVKQVTASDVDESSTGD